MSTTLPDKVSLSNAFSEIDEFWKPRVAGELNGQHVKLAKLKGEFIWHHHEHEDELFLIHSGVLRMEFRNGFVELHPGDFLVVPRGMEHRPVAENDVELVMFEPAGTLNTGNVRNERTVDDPAPIGSNNQ